MLDVTQIGMWDEFLAVWPAEKVRAMKLEEYTNLDTDTAFIYWLEFRLDGLGSISGGSAFKFGIYRRKDDAPKPPKMGYIWGEKYAWHSKFGQTVDEAYTNIHRRLVATIEAARGGNFERIDEIELPAVLKWKTAFLYQDQVHPGVLPIYKKEALFHHYRLVDSSAKLATTRQSVMYATLLGGHEDVNAESVVTLARELWIEWMKHQGGTRAWAVPIGVLASEAAESLAARTKVHPDDVGPALGELLNDSEVGKGDHLVLFLDDTVRAIGKVTSAAEGEYGWTQKPVMRRTGVATPPVDEVRLLQADEWKAIKTGSAVTAAGTGGLNRPDKSGLAEPNPPQNIILYGPPGTGKTYSTVRRALELVLGREKLAGIGEKGLTALFREHQARGQIEFVTFHQAYGYEEFVEGLRPVLDVGDGEDVRYELHSGVFKRIALRAAAEGLVDQTETPAFDELWAALVNELTKDGTRIATSVSGKTYRLELSSQGNVISRPCEVDAEGAITSLSENWQTASKENTQLFWEHRDELGPEPTAISSDKAAKLFAREKGGGGGNHYQALWIVYSRLYELSRSTAARKRELVDARTRVQQALDKPSAGGASFEFTAQTRQYVLIIDEINRGNVSRILGELITLLEPDKRLSARNELKLPLSYSPTHRFAVPPNLHLLGTMNTADRSIALMDVALRRRFTFEELMPSGDVLRSVATKRGAKPALVALVVDVFESLNARIRFVYDRDHQLGHAYFLDVDSLDGLRRVFVDRIVPLLQEYFYGAWDKISMVLGCPYDENGLPLRGGHVVTREGGRPVYAAPVVEASVFSEVDTLGFNHDEYEDRVDFTVRPEFQQGRLGMESLARTFLGVLTLEPAVHDARLAALVAEAAPEA